MDRYVKQAEFVEISGLSKGQVSKLCAGGKIDYDPVSKKIDLRGKKTIPFLPEDQREDIAETLKRRAQSLGGQKSSPEKYNPLIHNDMVRECASDGLDHLATASFLGISRTTFFNWRRDHPTFLNAWDEGLVIFAENALMKRAGGCSIPETKINIIEKEVIETEIMKHFPPETKATTYILNNRDRERWPDRQQIDLGAKVEATIKTKAEILAEILAYERQE